MKLDKVTRDRLAICYLKKIYFDNSDFNTRASNINSFERTKDIKPITEEDRNLSKSIYRILSVVLSAEEFNLFHNEELDFYEIEIPNSGIKELTINFLKDLYISKYDSKISFEKRKMLTRYDVIESINRMGSYLFDNWENWRKLEAYH